MTHAFCSPGSHVCQCKPGYTGNPLVRCVDIDECEEGNHSGDTETCGSEGRCVNLEGGFDCECPPGFVYASDTNGDSSQASSSERGCIDIDECALYFNPCGEGKGICTNKAPGYECQCDKGYRLVIDGSDQTCVDVDECEEGQVNLAGERLYRDEWHMSCYLRGLACFFL